MQIMYFFKITHLLEIIYIYAYNNPINFFDPNGHGAIWKWIKNKIIKPIERKLIKAATTVAKKIGLTNASNLLNHSLQDTPKNLNFGNNSKITKKIKSSEEFKQTINDLAKSQPNGTFDDYQQNLRFTSPDLMLALQNTTIHVDGTLNNGSGKLTITITDVYDFKHESYSLKNILKWPINFINNVAWIDQELGIINNYEIVIKFDYYVDAK